MTFQYENITVGADPELFLKDKVTGTWQSAVGLIGGTKERPKKIDRKGHAVQEDNVMVEFNIPPCRTEERFIKSINHVLLYLRDTLPKFDLVIEASAEFPKEQLQDPQSQRFGCEPDYDAWNIMVNNPPNPNTNIRTCGGHIHVGFDNPNDDAQIELVRAMDLFVGVPSIVLDPDKVRKSRYGKAGAFRPKNYGIEYRVVSNYWIKNQQLISWVYGNTMKAIQYLNQGNKIDDALGNRIQDIINSGNEKDAAVLGHEVGAIKGI